jgi:ribosomal protein L40E
MEWRCEWCGKPHAENDPPCDNCGHGSFERAVVRRTDLAGGNENPDTMTVWVCTACGREHPKHSPPCSRCNNGTLEQQEKRVDESNLTDGPNSTDTGGGDIGAEETTVWVCTACGREHPKHAPPCSRCGNADLERETRTVSEAETTVPGYRDLVTPQYLAVFLATLALAALLALGATGTVDLPGFPDNSVPSVDNVPGNGTAAGELSLSGAETAYLGALGDRRAGAGLDRLDRGDRLDEIARYYNQRRVKQVFDRGSVPDNDELRDLLGSGCSPARFVSNSLPVGTDGSNGVGERLVDSVGADSPPMLADADRIGVDFHSAGGTLFVTQVVCS